MTVDAILYGVAALAIGGYAAMGAHDLLRFSLRWPAKVSVAVALVIGAAFGVFMFGAFQTPVPSCIDFTPDASGRC